MKRVFLIIFFFISFIINVFGDCNRTTCNYIGDPAAATTSWQFVSGSVANGTTYNRYDFYLYSGNTYEFSLCATDGGASSYDSYLCLYGYGYGCGYTTFLTYNDDNCGTAAKITYLATSTGWTSLYISGYSTNYGTYTLAYRYSGGCTAPGAPSLTAPANNFYMQPGKTVTFSWNTPTGTAPFTYRVYIDGIDYSGALAGTSWGPIRFSEYGSASWCGNHTWYVTATNACGTGTSATQNLYIYPKFSGSSSDYSLTPSTSCQTTGLHSIVQGEAKYYSFSATATSTYYFSTCNLGTGTSCGTATGWDTYLKVYGTDGSCTTSALADDGSSCGSYESYLSWTCGTTGTYYIQITGYNSSYYGNYYIQYSCISPCTTPSDPSASGTSTICSGASTNISATSTNATTIYWYTGGCGTTLVGTSAPGANFPVSPGSTTTYYARGYNSAGGCWSTGCGSVTITVLSAFSAGAMTGPASATQCYNYNPTVLTANPTGGAGTYTYQWQSSPAGCGAWSNIAGATASTYDPPALTATTCYRVLVDATGSPDCGGSTASTNTFTYTILTNFSAGAMTGPASSTQCYNYDPTILTANPTGGAGTYTYQWQSSPAGCGAWSNIAGATASTYDPPALTATTCFRVLVDATGSPDCGGSTASTNTFTYTILVNFSAGAMTGPASSTQCYNYDPTVLTANPTGGAGTYTYQWQSSPAGCGAWTNIAGATASTYDPPALTATTCYRVLVDATGSPDCGAATASTNTFTYTILAIFSAGAMTGPASSTQCYNYDPTVLTANPSGGVSYSYQWQSSPAGCGAWSNIAGATASTYDPPALTATTCYRVLVDATGSPDCGGSTASTNTFTYTILANFSAGAMTGPASSTQCYNYDPTVLTANPSGGAGTYTYQWQSSPAGCGVWTNIAGATASTYDPPALTATTCYRVLVDATGSPDCGTATASTNTFTYTILANFSAGAMTGPASSTQCYNYDPTVLTANPSGGISYSYQWQSSPAGCGAWSNIAGATASTYDPPALTATTCFRVLVDATGSPDCGGSTASTNTFTYTILANFSAGAMTGPTSSTQCYNYDPTVLTANPTGGAGTYTYQWQSSPAGCGAWSNIAGATASTYDPPALTATTCYRVLVDATGSPDCGGSTASTNTFTYTILSIFSAGTITGGGGSFCDTGDPGVMTANPSGGSGTYAYQWYYKDGTGCPSTGGATLIAGATSQTYDPPAGLTVTRSYQCQVDATGSPDCGVLTWASNCVTVTINISSTSPTSASANPTSIASGGSSTLTVSGGSLGTGASWTWHTGNCAGAIAGTGNPITVYPAATTTYYVNAIGTCNTTTCVTVTVNVGSGLIGVINNGAVFYFKGSATAQAYMYIDGGTNGNFYNYTYGANNGRIYTENSGTNGCYIKLEGSWYNYVNNEVFQMSVAPTTRDYNTTEFMGTNAQSIGGDYITYFYNLFKSGAGTTTMNINSQVGGITALTGVFSLAGGPFNINGYLITVTNPATTAVTRTAGYIQSTTLDQAFNSRIQWNIGTTSGAHVFPFGTAASYIPFTFNLAAGANCGNLTLSSYPTGGADANTVYNNRPTIVTNLNGINTGTTPPANAANIVRRFWSISPTVNPLTGGSATLVFTYDTDANEAPLNGEDVNNMSAQRYNTPTNSWQPPLAGQTSNTTTNTVSVPGVIQMSPWTISKVSQPLPVELVEFSATCVDQTARLIWVTLSELNCDRYEIERSDNLNYWNYLATLNGAGNSTSKLNYLFTDPTPFDGLSYYKLKQIDFDGNFTYYGPVSVFCGDGIQETFEVINVNVNPQQNEIEIHYKTPVLGSPMCIVMYNTIGQQVINTRDYSTDETGIVVVESDNIATGIYLMSIECQQKVVTNKILIH